MKCAKRTVAEERCVKDSGIDGGRHLAGRGWSSVKDSSERKYMTELCDA